MDFDVLLYVLLAVIWLGSTVFKAFKKDEEERTAKKNRPISVETTERKTSGNPKQRETQPFFQSKPEEEEYFSYETMSERDFAKEFGHAEEEEPVVADVAAQQPAAHLTIDRESVFNGVIWSEILNRKY